MDKSHFNDEGVQVKFSCANCGEIVWSFADPSNERLPDANSIGHRCSETTTDSVDTLCPISH